LKHVPRAKIGKVDSLSRRLDWKVDIEKDNQDQVFIKTRGKDEEIVKVVEEMKKSRG